MSGRSFAGRVVVVTGAGSGIGRAIAQAFAAEGARLHLTDIREERLAEVARELTTSGAVVQTHLVDSREASHLERLASSVYETDANVDVLCNNAGVGHSAHAHEMPLETWKDVIDTNLMGVVHGIVAFLPRLLAQERPAHVVNIASVAGLIGVPGMSAYCASKFAVVGLTESLAIEVPHEKVKVTAICPGMIRTNIVQDAKIMQMGAVGREDAIRFYDRHAAGPEQVARDVINAVHAPVTVKLSAPGHFGFLCHLKRLSHGLYLGVSRWMHRHVRNKGLPQP